MLVEKPGMRIGHAWSKRIEGGSAPPGTAIRYAPSKIASGSSAETT